MKNDKVITAHNLTKKFGDFTAVDNISFEVSRGEIFGFLGANGAGKTTAIRMLCGLILPTSGSATVAGYDVYKQTELIKQNIGYMSQRFSFGQYHHVVFKTDENNREILEGISTSGNFSNVEIEAINPSIEDSFMALMKE